MRKVEFPRELYDGRFIARLTERERGRPAARQCLDAFANLVDETAHA